MVLPVCTVSASKQQELHVAGGVRAVCVTSEGNMVVCEEEGGTDIVRTYSSGGQHVNTTNLPEGCGIYSMTRHRDTIIAADCGNDSLHVCNNNGELITSIKLEFIPGSIASDGQAVWVYSVTDKQVYRLEIDNNYQVQQTNKVTLQQHITDSYNVFIAVNTERVAVSYGDHNKVHVYRHSGELLFVYGGEQGQGDNQLEEPGEVCLDDDNNVYIADSRNRRIVIVKADSKLAGYIHVGDEASRLDISNNILYVGCWDSKTVYTYKLSWF